MSEEFFQEYYLAMTQRFINEVLNGRNLDIIEEFFAPDFVEVQGPAPIHGPEGYRQYLRFVFSSYPDIQFKIEDFFFSGNKSVLRWSCTATHLGPWMGIPPTGQRIVDWGVNIQYWNADGKIEKEWLLSNAFGILIQLGKFKLPS